MDDTELKLPPFEVENVFVTFSQITDWGLRQLNVPETWKVTDGEGMTAMVIDTGHPVHPDIGDNARRGENFIAGEPIEDENGHQSHCTGIICAKNNDVGMVGVAPGSKCISVKALAKNGSGSYVGLAAALDYAIKVKPDVISMSLGGSAPSEQLHSRIKKLYDMNIPVVCAAGNTGQGGVNYPAAYDETIAVAAYDKSGNIAYFSSKGEQVEWAAPGVGIYSTYLNNGYASLSGTSMACPFITGVILLMLAKHKKQEELVGGENDCKTVEQIREHLLKYTDDKGAVGRDADWGYGVIDVEDLILGKDEEPIKKPVKPEPIAPEPTPTPSPWPVYPIEPTPTETYGVIIGDPPKKKKDNMIFIIVGVVVLLALVGVFAFNGCQEEESREGYLENGTVDFDKKYEDDMKHINNDGG
jgi:subtilisin family serine protease